MKVQIRIFQNGKVFDGEAILSEVHGHHREPVGRIVRSSVSKSTKPSGAVDGLYGKGFFASARALGDVVGQLGRDGYNFSAQSIFMSLKSRKYLHRRGTKGSYQFVQKYPPVS